MPYRLTQTDDIDEIRPLHDLALPGVPWVGDDHTFWIARDDTGNAVGFCSAIHREAKGYVYLSRSAVALAAQGAGLQRRMVHARLRWAKRLGASEAVTYTVYDNPASIVNLLRCGFRFWTPADPWYGDTVHYFRKDL